MSELAMSEVAELLAPMGGIIIIMAAAFGAFRAVFWAVSRVLENTGKAVKRWWGGGYKLAVPTFSRGATMFKEQISKMTLNSFATATAKVTAIVVCLVVLIFCYDLVMDKLRGRPSHCDAGSRASVCEETDGIWPFT